MLDMLKAGELVPNDVSRETFLFRVPLAKILANPYQTRITTDPDHIIGLARSIWDLREDLPITHGLQQPPTARIVRQDGDELIPIPRQAYRTPELLSDALTREDTYVQLFFGHSRHQAVRLLSGDVAGVLPQYSEDAQLLPGPDKRYGSMPLMLAYADDEHMWSHAENENRQRKNTTAIEDALSLRLAMTTFGWKQEEAAERAGMSRSAAANKLRLLNLPEDVQAKIQSGEISESHGRTLLTIVDAPERVQALASKAGTMSRRELEEATAAEKAKLDAEREKERQIAAVRTAGITIPFYDNTDGGSFQGFAPNAWLTDARLIETDACSRDCECMRLAYRPESWRTEISPLPDIAPNVRYGCVNAQAVRPKAEELRQAEMDATAVEKQRQQEDAERERKERIAAIEDAATSLLDSFMDSADVAGIWASADWWEKFVDGLEDFGVRATMIAAMKKHKAGNIEHMQAAALRAYVQGGTPWNQWLNANVVDIKAIKSRIRALGGIVAKRPQPASGDSQSPDWETGWDEEDEGEWRMLGAQPFAIWPEMVTRPRCILRAVGMIKSSETRAAFWKRYNELTQEEDND